MANSSGIDRGMVRSSFSITAAMGPEPSISHLLSLSFLFCADGASLSLLSSKLRTKPNPQHRAGRQDVEPQHPQRLQIAAGASPAPHADDTPLPATPGGSHGTTANADFATQGAH